MGYHFRQKIGRKLAEIGRIHKHVGGKQWMGYHLWKIDRKLAEARNSAQNRRSVLPGKLLSYSIIYHHFRKCFAKKMVQLIFWPNDFCLSLVLSLYCYKTMGSIENNSIVHFERNRCHNGDFPTAISGNSLRSLRFFFRNFGKFTPREVGGGGWLSKIGWASNSCLSCGEKVSHAIWLTGCWDSPCRGVLCSLIRPPLCPSLRPHSALWGAGTISQTLKWTISHSLFKTS